MNAVHWIEAIVLALAGIGCISAGRWRLAFAPLAGAAMVGAVAVAGY
jgi:hypothetical protein